MRRIYLDCSHGVSGDMVQNALIELTEDPASVRAHIEKIAEAVREKGADPYGPGHLHDHAHAGEQPHAHGHAHTHRSYREVMEIICQMPVSSRVKRTAEQIYAVIARAESAVHGDPLERLHFHEVGRDQAIANVLGVGICMDLLRPEQIIVSDICDGHGTVQCAHGILEVPVPAVKAMLADCDLTYRQTDYEGERVTPSGLAMLIGIGAATGEAPGEEPVRGVQVQGSRSDAEQGLTAQLY